MKKIKLGISKLDQLLDGGIPMGRVYLVTGEPGTGKTTLGLQFLLEGLDKGEKSLFICIDEHPEHIIENAASLGWSLTDALESETLSFLDATKYFGIESHLTDSINYNRIVDNLVQFISDNGTERLVIDPITPAIFSHSNASNISYFIRRFIFKLSQLPQCTSIITSPVSDNTIQEVLSSGVICLKTIGNNKQVHREMMVKKMRGVDITPCNLSYQLLSKKGIVIRS
mgnify:CR=1 FL=1